MLKLNLGSGSVLLPGWLNIDLCKEADMIFDLSRGIPSCRPDFIYSEHFIEHLTWEQAGILFKDCRKKLKQVMRIAMPDLDEILRKYFTDWFNQDWLTHPDYRFLNSKGKVVNHCFRGWGHQYLYNFEDLSEQLKTAGFQNIKRVGIGESQYEELRGLETRKESTLIIEVW